MNLSMTQSLLSCGKTQYTAGLLCKNNILSTYVMVLFIEYLYSCWDLKVGIFIYRIDIISNLSGNI